MMPWNPPSMPWLQSDKMTQAMNTASKVASQPAIERIMQNRENIKKQVQMAEEYGALAPAIQQAIQDQEAFNALRPEIDHFKHEMAALGAKPPYMAPPPYLLQAQIDAAEVQRTYDLYRQSLPENIEEIIFVQNNLAPIQTIVSSFASQAYLSQLNRIITEESRQSFHDFIVSCQRKCSQVLLDAHWCPSAILALPLSKLKPLCSLVDANDPADKKNDALDQFIFRHLGMRYTDCLLEDWNELPLLAHIRRLLKETLYAYRRKEYGIVVSVLPTLWEGIIREKANITEQISSKELRKAFAKLVEPNERSAIISAFYDTCIMYHCSKQEDAIPDVPGRHAAAHGWFTRYPPKKAALNALLFTDFLVNLECLESDSDNGNIQEKP